MSYPPNLYDGADGEVSARLRAHDAEPDIVYPSGVRVSYLASSTQTDGQFGLYRWNMTPENTGADPHFHRTFAESFFVISGTVRLFDGETWVDGNAGDFLYVPPGGVHGFKNESAAEASMLILFTPGAPREGYFEGLLALRQGDWTPGRQELTDFFEHHDNHSV